MVHDRFNRDIDKALTFQKDATYNISIQNLHKFYIILLNVKFE